jgi:uncharacterized protein involved in oxidation of intracellular sulfur
MKVTVVIYSNDPETIWNAFRLANAALGYDDEVSIFLLGKGVECASIRTVKYDIQEQMKIFNEFGGTLIGCGVCCDSREDEFPLLKEDLQCEMGSMQQLYVLMKEADKVVTF